MIAACPEKRDKQAAKMRQTRTMGRRETGRDSSINSDARTIMQDAREASEKGEEMAAR
jgi:hypothetical protein